MCRAIVKYLVFLFNLIFVIFGIAVIVLGTILHYKFDALKERLSADESTIKIVPILVIVMGCVIFLIAFAGCCGAVTETQCLLITYACFMVVTMAFEIYIVVLLFKDISKIPKTIEKVVDDKFIQNNHKMERALECCGTYGPKFYKDIHSQLPSTCCEYVSDACDADALSNAKICLCKKEDAVEVGCVDAVSDAIKKYGNTVGYAIIGFIVIELLAAISAVYLANSVDGDIKHGMLMQWH